MSRFDILSLFAEPLMISEFGLQLALAVATQDEFFSGARAAALAARDGAPLENKKPQVSSGAIAVVPVMGPLFRHADMFTKLSGATSYSAIREQMKAAADDQKVKEILMHFDTPGGEAKGATETADLIARINSNVKPVRAFVEEANSAGYLLASATREIVAAPMAELGSIGVIASVAIPDDKGGRRIEIVSSRAPHKRLDVTKDEDRAQLQQRIDDMEAVFVNRVATNRNVSPEAVAERFGGGGIMVGQRAVDAGLADRIGDFDSMAAEAGNRQSLKYTLTNGRSK